MLDELSKEELVVMAAYVTGAMDVSGIDKEQGKMSKESLHIIIGAMQSVLTLKQEAKTIGISLSDYLLEISQLKQFLQ